MSKSLLAIMFLLLVSCSLTHNLLETNEPPVGLTEALKFPELNNRWALVIGVSNYADPSLNLKYSAKDATGIYNALVNKCRFPKGNIRLLVNEDATYENIRKSIEGWLYSNTKSNDKVVVFFSGHGYRDVDNNGDEADGFDEFLVPYDFSRRDISSAIRDDSLSNWISNLKSENVLLLFDSCFSGGAAKAKGLTNQGISFKGVRGLDGLEGDVVGEVPRKGVALMSASRADEYSFESDDLKMGVFSYFFIKSLDKSSDLNLDHFVNVNEAFTYLKSSVVDYVRQKYSRIQEPTFINTLPDQLDLAFLPPDMPTALSAKTEKDELIKRLSLSSGDEEKAIEILDKIVELDPKDTRYRDELAMHCLIYRYYDKAIYNYELLISTSMNGDKLERRIELPYYFSQIAEAYASKGDYAEAIGYLNKQLDFYKDSSDSLELGKIFAKLGELYSKNGQSDEAIKSYLLSLQNNSVQDKTYLDLAAVYIQQQLYKDALSIISRAITTSPDYGQAYYLKSVLLRYVLSDEAESRQFYNDFIKLEEKGTSSDISSMKQGIDIIKEGDTYLTSASKEIRESRLGILIPEITRFIKAHSIVCDAYIVLIQLCQKYDYSTDIADKYISDLVRLYPFFEKYRNDIKSLRPFYW
jgi:tetratricopeptide (TPR) repeat protein